MTEPVPNPHAADGIAYGHVFASYTEGTADTSLDLDPYPDERWLSGSVTFRPKFSGQQATATLRVPGTPRSRGLVITELEYKIVNSRLVDRQDREGVWLTVRVGDIPVHWQATVVLRDAAGKVVLTTAYVLTPEAWVHGLDGSLALNLPDLIPNPGLITPSELAAILSAQSAMERSLEVAAVLEEVRPDIVAAGGRATDAIAAAGTAERAADRATGLAGAQDEHVAVVLEDPESETNAAFKRVGNATYERQRSYSANAYGAAPGASWEANRDAFQSAVDAAHTAGGGAVVAVSGTYLVKGIVQKSNVTFQGPYTLRHPDGQTGHVIAGQLFAASGAIAAGSRTLTLGAPAPDLAAGSVVAIRGAGGMSESAISTLATQLVPGDTAIALTDQASLFGGGSFLAIGSELIQYTSASGGVLSGVVRGALGTPAGTHASGAWIGQAIRLYARVEKVDGTTVTLDRPAKIGVSGASIQYGIVRPAIVGGVEFEGQRPPGGAAANPYPVSWETVGGGTIDVLNVERAEAALDLRHGTMDCTIGAINAHECGNAPVSGAAVWLFRGCEDNHFGSIKAHGEDTYTGIYMDDRTSTSTEWDAPCVGNTVDVLDVRRPWVSGNPTTGIGVNITNGSRNYLSHIRTHGVRTPIVVNGLSQVYRPDSSPTPTWSRNNRIGGGVITAAYQPWAISAPDVVIANLYWETVSPSSGYADFPVRLVNTGAASGQPPAATTPRFPDGTSPAPGIAFTDDPDTGFRRMTSGDVAYISDGLLKFRMRPNGILLNDGYGFEFNSAGGGMIGTGFGQKIGFWGATPTSKPAAIPNAADAASTQARLNDLLASLRTIGIIAT